MVHHCAQSALLLTCLTVSSSVTGVYKCFFCVLQASKKQKLFLMSWCPDTAKVKKKMLYSSSFDALKKSLVGVQKYIQVSVALFIQRWCPKEITCWSSEVHSGECGVCTLTKCEWWDCWVCCLIVRYLPYEAHQRGRHDLLARISNAHPVTWYVAYGHICKLCLYHRNS